MPRPPHSRLRRFFYTLPFHLITLVMMTAIWQNDHDFFLGNVSHHSTIVLDHGKTQISAKSPRYFPSFRLENGQTLKVTRALDINNLPALGQSVELICSQELAQNCQVKGKRENMLFYCFVLIWGSFSALLTWGLLRR
jgi:hypothetical protein